jgi:hypothetical protein
MLVMLGQRLSGGLLMRLSKLLIRTGSHFDVLKCCWGDCEEEQD